MKPNPTALKRLEALIAQESAKRLIRLGGSDPGAEAAPRRRPWVGTSQNIYASFSVLAFSGVRLSVAFRLSAVPCLCRVAFVW